MQQTFFLPKYMKLIYRVDFLCMFAYANANCLKVKSACEYSILSHTASVTVYYKNMRKSMLFALSELLLCEEG
jgi:hypothetical protein